MGYFASFSDFLAMGGHAFYVWMSYGLTLLIFIFNLLALRQKHKRFLAQAKRQLKREQRPS